MAKLTLRRMRLSRHLRELSREVVLDERQFIQPLFVVEGIAGPEPVPGLRDVYRDTSDSVLAQIEKDLSSGIRKFLLFGVPANKQSRNIESEFTNRQIAMIKRQFGDDLWLAVDTCLCSHTDHGHCGVLNDAGDYVDNEASVEELVQLATAYAIAGADSVAPSDMMDGRVGAIRDALDQNSLSRTTIMSYAAKFQSSLYGPFRLAADSSPSASNKLDGRTSYQLDPARPGDALASAQRDADEGADMLMVKPGLPYLDILASLSAAIAKPWVVYQTSGEQAAIDVLAQERLLDRNEAQLETWTAFRRAGASAIISYAARRAPQLLAQRSSD